MKKFILLLLCLIVTMVSAMGFVGCGKTEEADQGDSQKQEETIDDESKSDDNKDSEDEKKEDDDQKSLFTPVTDGGNYTPSKDYE